jgi:hypothetical protein
MNENEMRGTMIKRRKVENFVIIKLETFLLSYYLQASGIHFSAVLFFMKGSEECRDLKWKLNELDERETFGSMSKAKLNMK